MKEKTVCRCLNCGQGCTDEAFLTNENGMVCLILGKDNFKNQVFGKRKTLQTRVCAKCGFVMTFVKDIKDIKNNTKK
ncbi:MAG: hypothetical protein KKF44_04470 [Nanoarchaeota archaeon]|nr:hypothetical protein [Nanoarchaeota archaeon]